MKALTVKQPYAYLICAGIKPIENRTWKTNYRGRVLIHAGADTKLKLLTSLTKKQYEEAYTIFQSAKTMILPVNKWDRSAIIGSVEIVDCVQNHPSIWAEKGVWHWVLANPVLFANPIKNVKGKLSFWEYPNIHAEKDDEGKDICCCQLPVKDEEQIFSYGGIRKCRYCGGKWYR
jgi:hypothetical protein